MKIFLICPVRNASQGQIQKLKEYKNTLRRYGHEVYYPTDDNPYEDSDDVGFTICTENAKAIQEADEVHIFWDKNSSGSLFDLGCAFGLGKPLRIVNLDEVERTEGKSFANMILKWSATK
jgi:nucleoside 2-deoxyribosyltransferase